MKPVDEMNLEELKDCLCNNADGKIESCLSCSTKCKFGSRIENLLQAQETTPPDFLEKKINLPQDQTQSKKQATQGKVNYLLACASGDPVRFYKELGYKKNTIYSSRHIYGSFTPEEAMLELEKLSIAPPTQFSDKPIKTLRSSVYYDAEKKQAMTNYYAAVASGSPLQWYKAHNYHRSTFYGAKKKYGECTPEEAEKRLAEMGVEIEKVGEEEMASKPSLLNEVTIQEMQRLREEYGYSNKKIAEILGCTYQTVVKYLGKQPKEVRASYGAYVKPVSETPNLKYTPTWNAEDWETAETIHKLTGTYMHYEVNSTSNFVNVTLLDGHSLGKLDKADLMKCIDELSRVAELIR